MKIFKSKTFWLVLCLALLLAPVAWYASLGVSDTINELKSDHAAPELDEKVSSFDGTEIAYSVSGNGPKTLLFVHGWTRTSADWADQAAIFADGYQTVVLDLAGHGSSGADREEWSVKNFSRDVVAVIDQLKVDDVIVVGHSMGGLVAMEMARSASDKISGVVIVDEIYDVESKEASSDILTAKLLTWLNYDFTLQLFLEDFFIDEADEDLKNKIIAESYALPGDISRKILFGDGGYFDFYNEEVLPAFKATKLPIAFINADGGSVAKETNQKYQPGLIVEEIPNSGHFFIVEEPVKFTESLRSVLSKWDGS